MVMGAVLMGWRWDEFVGQAIRITVHNDLPANVHIEEPSQIPWSQARWLGDIEDLRLNESSGLAASNYVTDVLWSINDSGDGPNIFALSTAGNALGRWQIDVDKPIDWEAMDAFSINGNGYLLIADVGDNFARRQSVSFLVVEEPWLEADQEQPLPVAWQVEFSYPNGPRDSEAVAVDPALERVLILSKRTFPNELYWVPLRVRENTTVVAEKIANLYPLPRNVPGNEALYGPAAPYQGMPTGMSLKANRLLVTTYRDAYLYDYGDVTQEPSRIPLPLVGQREAIAFARDADSTAYVSRERKDATEVAEIFELNFGFAAPE
jgi:hypothetical protein